MGRKFVSDDAHFRSYRKEGAVSSNIPHALVRLEQPAVVAHIGMA